MSTMEWVVGGGEVALFGQFAELPQLLPCYGPAQILLLCGKKSFITASKLHVTSTEQRILAQPVDEYIATAV